MPHEACCLQARDSMAAPGDQSRALPDTDPGPASMKEAWESTNTVFTNDKAGMGGYDKDHVKKVIYEMSKDSPHFRNEQRKQQQTEARIRRLKHQATQLSAHELAGHTRKMDAKISGLLANRDLSRTWIHVDLDAFYASVEELDDPSLKTKPMGVGGIGMLATANYVARRYGIRSAMPGFIAKRLCPELVFVKPDFKKYSKASHAVRAIFRDYDPDLEAASLDEAYLDITDYCREHGMAGGDVAAEMRARVLADTGLTCSCGVAPNRMLAKVCSDINKPNGQCVLAPDPNEIRRFTDTLTIRKIPGIGKVGEQELKALGVEMCSDLIRKRGLLSALYSDIAIDSFMEAGLGLGRTRHHDALKEGEVGRKGISVERTFTPISLTKDLEAKCVELAGKLAEDMEAESLRGKTLTLKLKPLTFELRTRAVTLPQYISSQQEIQAAALKLLRAQLPVEVRLMGLRMSSFYQVQLPPGQQSLATFFKPKGSQDSDAGSGRNCGFVEEGEDVEAEAPAGSAAQAALQLSEELELQTDTAEKCTALESQPETRPSSKVQTGLHKKMLWACQLCTFSENPWHFLRCLICDEWRGSAPKSFIDNEPSMGWRAGRQESPRKGCYDGDPSAAEPSRKRKAAGFDEGTAVAAEQTSCPKCGQPVPLSKEQEHQDYHLALELAAQTRGSQRLDEAKHIRDSSKQRQKGKEPHITAFFRPSSVSNNGCKR